MAHYSDPRPAVASRPSSVEVPVRAVGRTLVLATDRGVFAADRLDHGTRVLLEHAPPPPEAGHLLDLGCGYGPIALSMAIRSPAATVWAVDVNERALDLCRANATTHGLARVRVGTGDEVPADVRFAAIWSNPPIRIGAPALHVLLTTWLDRLAAGGVAHLVVQRHLGGDTLAAWLEGEGWPTTRARSKQGFRLLEVGARSGAA